MLAGVIHGDGDGVRFGVSVASFLSKNRNRMKYNESEIRIKYFLFHPTDVCPSFSLQNLREMVQLSNDSVAIFGSWRSSKEFDHSPNLRFHGAWWELIHEMELLEIPDFDSAELNMSISDTCLVAIRLQTAPSFAGDVFVHPNIRNVGQNDQPICIELLSQ